MGSGEYGNRARLRPRGKDGDSSRGENEFFREILGVVNAGYGVIGQSILLLRNAWPKTLQVLQVFKEQGSILAVRAFGALCVPFHGRDSNHNALALEALFGEAGVSLATGVMTVGLMCKNIEGSGRWK
ncbi:hypothetical protein PanWU01x14_142950 [Parasponia andersonii]|uniref:Uncharacterized protein n=1 Tax=Parasponia andersonii TaxID=3476 RepID=A0A2P5CLE0_PARAD|nr:hypothetical protein PanWU01x14_142950 [Parasponia andersonii]